MNKADSILVPEFAGDGPDYEVDFCAWSEEQARRIRSLRIPGLDVENVAEEIESLSRSDKRQLRNRLQVLLTHLLKWDVQPMARSSGWRGTIREQRRRIDTIVSESPSLRPALPGILTDRFPAASDVAASETGMTLAAFPTGCAWSVAEVLDLDFFPGAMDDG